MSDDLARINRGWGNPYFGLMLVLLGLLLLLGFFLWSSHEQTLLEAELNSRNLTKVIESRLASDFARVDGLLAHFVRQSQRDDFEGQLSAQQRQLRSAYLASLIEGFPTVASLNVFDAQGIMRYSSDLDARTVEIADRPHIAQLRANPQRSRIFSPALVSRATGQWAITRVHAVRDEQGDFLGNVSALIHLEELSQLMSGIDVGADGLSLLRRSDDFRLLMRTPKLNEADFNQPLPESNPIRQAIASGQQQGTLRYRASTDGVERIASFRVLRDLPFYVQVSLGRDDVLAQWRALFSYALILALLLMLSFAYVLSRLVASEANARRALGQLAYRQALFSALFEQSDLVRAVLSREGNLLEINDCALRVMDCAQHQPLGQYFPDSPCWAGQDAATKSALVAMLDRAAQGIRGELLSSHPQPDGSEARVRIQALPVQVGKDQYIALSGLDITQQEAREHALTELANELSASNAELEQFAYVASHDLRQPLRMVTSYVQLLERRLDKALDEDTRQMMHFATDGVKRMEQMLLSLLEYSRVGRMGEPMAPLNSRQALDEALGFLQPAIEESAAEIRVTGDWPQLVASRDELTRLFQNLVGNAIKYRDPKRKPEIDIQVESTPGGWCFAIIDNGIGIDPGQLDRLFRVFQRLHPRDKYEGTGIGLAVARKIVERHGGRIWMESDGEGQGCRLFFTLRRGAS